MRCSNSEHGPNWSKAFGGNTLAILKTLPRSRQAARPENRKIHRMGRHLEEIKGKAHTVHSIGLRVFVLEIKDLSGGRAQGGGALSSCVTTNPKKLGKRLTVLDGWRSRTYCVRSRRKFGSLRFGVY